MKFDKDIIGFISALTETYGEIDINITDHEIRIESSDINKDILDYVSEICNAWLKNWCPPKLVESLAIVIKKERRDE